MEVRVLPDPSALAGEAVDVITDLLRDHTTLGLAGGSTPQETYRLLRDAPIDWPALRAWVTDERHVPHDHPDSNAGAAQRSLFAHVPCAVEMVPWDPDPAVSASLYEERLGELLPAGPDGPEPEVVLLGIGEDGHTASLFPGCTALEEDERSYVATEIGDGKGWRLTATLPLLARAGHIVFLAAGKSKAPAIAEILTGSSDLPAAVVARNAPSVLLLVDRAAAGEAV
jgi:6-phosphogluconolactonase